MQEHNKSVAKKKAEAHVFADAVRLRGPAQRSEPTAKRNKHTKEMLDGKKVIDLQAARALAPSPAYLYETTDGLRIRVFFGKERKSTSAMLSVGRARALLKCLKWSWAHMELGGSVCPYDLDKVKVL